MVLPGVLVASERARGGAGPSSCSSSATTKVRLGSRLALLASRWRARDSIGVSEQPLDARESRAPGASRAPAGSSLVRTARGSWGGEVVAVADEVAGARGSVATGDDEGFQRGTRTGEAHRFSNTNESCWASQRSEATTRGTAIEVREVIRISPSHTFPLVRPPSDPAPPPPHQWRTNPPLPCPAGLRRTPLGAKRGLRPEARGRQRLALRLAQSAAPRPARLSPRRALCRPQAQCQFRVSALGGRPGFRARPRRCCPRMSRWCPSAARLRSTALPPRDSSRRTAVRRSPPRAWRPVSVVCPARSPRPRPHCRWAYLRVLFRTQIRRTPPPEPAGPACETGSVVRAWQAVSSPYDCVVGAAEEWTMVRIPP